MKKIKIVILSLLALSLISCAGAAGGGGGGGSGAVNIVPQNGIRISPTQITIPQQYEGKRAFIAVMNNTNETKSVVKNNPSTSSNVNQKPKSTDYLSVVKNYSIPPKLPEIKIDLKKQSFLSRSARAASTTTPVMYSIGDTKDFYGFGDDTFTHNYAESSVLKVIGNHCRVWYKAKDGITITDLDNKLQNLADKFDDIFEKETYIFGSNIPTYQYSNIININSNTKIEILVYDLYDNYLAEAAAEGGVYGYFSKIDFYNQNQNPYILKTSNECECIHIDSYWLEQDSEASYSTAAHEFQHLLHFVNKSLNANQVSDVWFNEMLSMVCEDIMQSQLNIQDTGSPKNRLAIFNSFHNLGFTTWREYTTDFFEDTDVYISYANAYAFGAYLLRNYGIEFFRVLAHNEYINQTAITKALQQINANEKSFDQVFANYCNVIINPTGTNYTLNKATSQTYNINNTDEVFSCDAINLTQNSEIYLTMPAANVTSTFVGKYYGSTLNQNFYGPLVFNPIGYYSILDPQGMFAIYLDTIDENETTTYNFTAFSDYFYFNTGLDFYLIFVD